MVMPLSLDRAPLPPEARGLFREIKEHPADDTPRLIFADWLEENGDEAAAARGEFLRLSVLRGRLGPDDPEHGRLKRREGQLFRRHRWTWLGPLADGARIWTFERGMLQIRARAERVLGPEISVWAETPMAWWVDALALTDVRPDHIGPLVKSRLLAHLNALDLSNNRLGAAAVAALARCRSLDCLTLLDLESTRLDDAAAFVLADWPRSSDLAALHVGRNHFSPVGSALLCRVFGGRAHF